MMSPKVILIPGNGGGIDACDSSKSRDRSYLDLPGLQLWSVDAL